ncbi:MAG TPA: N-acetylmuramoyl-L-alanine amidase [Terriglobales bacterium]
MKIGVTTLTRISLAALLACALLPLAQARTVQQKKQAARQQFEIAERLREALNGKRESQRTRRDYLKVIDAYRKVYYTAPNSIKADTAVLTVAELLDDQGRVLKDPKSYNDAIGQLVFLRREYPGSKYRVEALFTIGQIYRDDLSDAAQARATFEDFLKHYPASPLASDAKHELVEIGDPALGGNPFHKKSVGKNSPRAIPPKAAWAESSAYADEEAPAPAAADEDKPAKPAPSRKVAVEQTPTPPADEDAGALQPASTPTGKSDSQQPRHLAHLTSVRHWSTPDYTRVAIDLEQEVQYQAGRVPHPDRIFFDLYDTKLASDLIGKSFDVEAGFLHRIRVAQYKANMARVVLDVDDVAEYSAFLLPNPYRLIIDIHGKLPPPQQVAADKKPAKLETNETEPDVTVTQVKPTVSTKPTEGAVAQAIDRAEKSKPGPLRIQDSKTQDKTASAGDKTNVARATPQKIDADDTVLADDVEDPVKVSKPTTGPTFQAVAPEQSTRTRKRAAEPTSASALTGHAAAPTASGDRSLIRALGLKIGKIVVDAGHGGHDTGTVGPNGLTEKDLVLDVALKLGKLLESRLGAEVVYTRDTDTFIPLETRTAIANKEQADLFISIHANSSSDSSARGVETYYLNFTSSRDALDVAARENAVSEKSIHELQDLVKKIALKEKIEESREFAGDVEKSLYTGLSAKSPGLHNRGVKKAPFVVLIGANMPSILAEISFISNPTDERKLKTNEYRQRVAESLYKGVSKYVSGLSGVKLATQGDEKSGSSLASK